MFGITEWLIIAGILILLFGASRIPRIGEGMGKGIRNFLNAVKSEPQGENSDKVENKSE